MKMTMQTRPVTAGTLTIPCCHFSVELNYNIVCTTNLKTFRYSKLIVSLIRSQKTKTKTEPHEI